MKSWSYRSPAPSRKPRRGGDTAPKCIRDRRAGRPVRHHGSCARAPPLVEPFAGPEHGRYLAEHIHGARYVELSGVDHLFFAEDVDRLLAEVQEFLTGVREARETDRVWRPSCLSTS